MYGTPNFYSELDSFYIGGDGDHTQGECPNAVICYKCQDFDDPWTMRVLSANWVFPSRWWSEPYGTRLCLSFYGHVVYYVAFWQYTSADRSSYCTNPKSESYTKLMLCWEESCQKEFFYHRAQSIIFHAGFSDTGVIAHTLQLIHCILSRAPQFLKVYHSKHLCHAKRTDAALPGKPTRQLYDWLSWKEASVLTQLRTGMARLNGYLYQINAA